MGYVEVDEKILEKIHRITITNYENKGCFLPAESVQPMLEDLLYEIESLEEKLHDEVEQRESYYRPLSHRELEGVPSVGPID